MATYDFEDGLLPDGWSTAAGANAGWSVVSTDAYSGTYSLKAGAITDSQTAAIEVTKVCLSGTLSYYWKVSSEPSYDYLRFYINGVEQTDARKSGVAGWSLYSKAITAGTYTFKWAYTKDSSVSQNADTAWIDLIDLPEPALFPVSIPELSLDLIGQPPLFLPIIPPSLSLTITTIDPLILPIQAPFATLSLTENLIENFGILSFSVAEALTLTAEIPSIKSALTGPATLALVGAATLTKKPLARNAPISLTLSVVGTIFRGLIIAAPAVYRTLYRAYLIKTGETDLELPISSFQARRRDGDPSYLAITVPAPNDYLAGITARSGGQLVLKSGFVNLATGEETITELQRVDFDYFRYDLGARSGSATLSGHRTTAAREPLTVALRGISYRAVTNGVRNVRCEPDMYLSPGDTADVGGGETFVVSSISYTVNPRAATMEVQEVEA